MDEKVDIPLQLPESFEVAVQQVANHTGYTRDEVIEKIMAMTLEMADSPTDHIEKPPFLEIIKKALQQATRPS